MNRWPPHRRDPRSGKRSGHWPATTTCSPSGLTDDETPVASAQTTRSGTVSGVRSTKTFVYLKPPSNLSTGWYQMTRPSAGRARHLGCTTPGCRLSRRSGAGHRARRRYVHLRQLRQALPGPGLSGLFRRAAPGTAEPNSPRLAAKQAASGLLPLWVPTPTPKAVELAVRLVVAGPGRPQPGLFTTGGSERLGGAHGSWPLRLTPVG